jgi:heptaprenyl diphosphate synthase
MVSNVSQLVLAALFVFGKSALLIAPVFLGAGLITGLALGVFCERFAEKSVWYETKRKARTGKAG